MCPLSKLRLTVFLGEFDHLRHCFGAQNWQIVRNEKEPLAFVSFRLIRLDSSKCDALSVIRASSSSVNERRVESVNLKVELIDLKPPAYCLLA